MNKAVYSSLYIPNFTKIGLHMIILSINEKIKNVCDAIFLRWEALILKCFVFYISTNLYH